MKLTDEQRLDLFKRAIPYLIRYKLGYCSAFQYALIDMGLFVDRSDKDPYTYIWKINNMRDFQPFFKLPITTKYLLPFEQEDESNKHRINVLKYLINQLEIKLYGEVQTDYSEK